MTLGGFRLIEKGMEFDFFTDVTEASRGVNTDEPGALLWRETSTYFVRGKFGAKRDDKADDAAAEKSFELESLDKAELLQQWHIPKSRGRAYASISGDYNPIHMSSLAAKAFGFKRDIAHGFGVMAQAIDRAKALPNADTLNGKAVQVDVIFKGPIFLDSEVSLKHEPEQFAGRFDLFCGNNPRPNLCIAVTTQGE
jgi:acyl dehydratase